MKALKNIILKWLGDEDGVAATEAALVFPILLVLLLGTFDLGNGILANQKTIRASQVTADLITRYSSVTDSDIDEAIQAGTLAFTPYPVTSYGVDIVSIQFDHEAEASILWRETRNMQADEGILERVESLAEPNGGVVVVISQYLFEPVFGEFIVDDIPMQEVAFARGRESASVSKD